MVPYQIIKPLLSPKFRYKITFNSIRDLKAFSRVSSIMKEFISFLTFCLIFINSCDATEYSCKNMTSGICFVNLIVTPSFIVKSDVPENVRKLIVLDSVIPKLSGGFCMLFPNLDEFRSYNCSIESFDIESFVDCSNLSNLRLEKEKIEILEAKMFHHLVNLEILFLGKNKLRSIHPEAFVGLENLKGLILPENELIFFDPEVLKPLKSLSGFVLFNNNLEDLDVERILQIVPLQMISINDNNFPCKRLKEMLKILKSADIKMPDSPAKPKTRSYPIKNTKELKNQ